MEVSSICWMVPSLGANVVCLDACARNCSVPVWTIGEVGWRSGMACVMFWMACSVEVMERWPAKGMREAAGEVC